MKKALGGVWLTLLLVLAACGGVSEVPETLEAAPQATPSVITQWTFDGNTTVPSAGSGTATGGPGLGGEAFFQGNPNSGSAWSFNSWSTGNLDATKWVEFALSTEDASDIVLSFDERRSGTGPSTLEVRYSTDGATFVELPEAAQPIRTIPNNTSFRTQTFDLGGVEALNEQERIAFRIYGYGASSTAGTWRFDNVTISGHVTGDGDDSPPPSACGEEATLISTVQGSGATSPIVGQNVTVEAVVVGDFQGDAGEFSNLSGFYLQEEKDDQDLDPATSEGLFVFAPNAQPVSEGDVVRVTGTVAEFTSSGSSLTQLSNLTNLSVCGPVEAAQMPTPVDVTLPLASPDALESLEGMLVRLPQTLVISEYFNFDRFGEITLALPNSDLGAEVDRLYTPTSYVEPGAEANAEAAENALRRITLDDGRTSQNPDPARHPNGERFTLQNRFRGGDTVQDVVGVVDQRFGLYRIQPTQGAIYTATNPRPQAPDPVGGSLTVASFNVLNYFTTLNRRGATTPEELERQAAKIVAALAVIDADVVGLIEIENNGPTAVGDLVGRLNAAVGANTYAFIDTGRIGSDEITNALIYKPSTVTPAGNFALLDSSKDPRFLDTKNRPVLIQTFDQNATGGRVTVAVNHFKSKGSNCNDVNDPDRGDGQANCNGTRTQAAQALADFLATDPTGSGDPDFLIIGDLNAYDEEDPIRALESAGYTDLLERFQGEFSYTYVFDGQFGYLDYALANSTLNAQVTGTTAWAINADEPDILDYTTRFKQTEQQALFEPNAFSSSDHDPVIVGLSLTGSATDPEPTPEEALARLKADVQALSGSLNPGQLRSLLAQLDTAERHLERDQTRQAAGALGRFEDGVRRLIRQGALTEAQGQPLLDASSAIRAQL